jgi:hypothetical protein
MRLFAVLCLFYLSAILSQAQVIIAPLEYRHEQSIYAGQENHSRLKVASTTLSIPFFDDFTQTNKVSDPIKWVSGGGVYINNNYPVNQPNFNVATFDGIKGNGTPYNPNNQLDVGATDSLTSQPIDLSFLKKGDSVYLRYFFQPGGIGDPPDVAKDSIRLQFKKRDSTWVTVWVQISDTNHLDSTFYFNLVRIGDSVNYFHNAFQFSFQSFGRRSGNYDIWNLDYIMLDTGQLAKANHSPDLSFRSISTSFLKTYTAMPERQYKANPKGETADSLAFVVTNLRNFQWPYSTQNNRSFLADIVHGDTIQHFTTTGVQVPPYGSLVFKYKIDTSNLFLNHFPKVLEYQSVVEKALDPMKDTIYTFLLTPSQVKLKSDIDFTANDTIKGFTNITNYYSYDDGSAEYGFGVNQSLGKVAVQYHVNVPDSITHIQIQFPNLAPIQTNQSIILLIWENIQVGTSNADIVNDPETVILKYATSVDGFTTYQLDKPYYVSNPNTTIYVGYQQESSIPLYVGFDKNTNSNDKIFYNVNNKWNQYITDPGSESGSLMIRPVFATDIPLGINLPKTYKTLDATIYPNPNKGEITIEGKVRRASLYDLTGKLMHAEELDSFNSSNRMDLSSLPNGLYILQLENGDSRAMEKIYINK